MRKSDNRETGARWDGPAGPILVDVKRTNSIRDVRGSLVALAYQVHHETTACQAVCVLAESRLSHRRLQDELNRLRDILRPEIANRLHFLASAGGSRHRAIAFRGSIEGLPGDFYAWLGRLHATERSPKTQLPARRIVVAALAQLRLWNQPPVTIRRLQDTCGVSYPTVAGALKELVDKGWLEDSGKRGVRLRHLTAGEWMEMARDHGKLRNVFLFTDPTGHASPEQMFKRLGRLQAAGKLPRSVLVGGVLGASGHCPKLDITAAPRLDLSVDADPTQLAELLDAGLSPKARPEQRVALAVHVTYDARDVAGTEQQPQDQWAGELDCLADLIEMGFTREALELAQHMETDTKQGRPGA